jgi:enoyl-CoA hydratase
MAIRAEDLVKKAKEFIEYKKDKKTKIAYLTLNRPDQYNATTVGMRLLYGDLIHRANIDDNVKVLVIRGAGDHFGTGGDLDEQNDAYTEGAEVSLLHEFEIDDPDVQYPTKDAFRYIHGLCEHYTKARGGCRTLQDFKKISIVEAKGYCYGWHFYQAADADLVVSSEDALFGHPAFRYVGWAPRMWTWAMTMGLRKFQEMVFTGPPLHGAGDVRVQLRQQRRAARETGGGDAQVRDCLLTNSAGRYGGGTEDFSGNLQAISRRIHGEPAVCPIGGALALHEA